MKMSTVLTNGDECQPLTGESRTVHSPDLDLPVVSSRHDERHAGVKSGPVDPPVVTLETKIQSGATQMVQRIRQLWQKTEDSLNNTTLTAFYNKK